MEPNIKNEVDAKVFQDKLSHGKYGAKTKQPFPDPIIRCDSCQAIVHRRHISQMGCCHECGNRRFRNALTLKEEEMEQLKKDGVDPEFLAIFEEVELESVS